MESSRKTKRPAYSLKQRFGREQEQLGARYLEARGLQLVSSNFHCRLGEIDLIMTEGPVLVFVEVRYRRSSRFGSPIATVDHRKQRKLLRCAEFYLLRHGLTGRSPCRFDVLGISPTEQGPEPAFRWIKNAFQSHW